MSTILGAKEKKKVSKITEISKCIISQIYIINAKAASVHYVVWTKLT